MTDTPETPVEDDAERPDFARGLAYLKKQIKTLPHQPGVYRMFNAAGDSLYVGKARHLAKRVTSYTQPNRLSSRLMQMVAETIHLEITMTNSEVEALLLESNLIKQLRPRYNILLKDDKSFAYILLAGAHDFPQLTKHRGAQKRTGDYYGPFASAGAVNRTITSLSRAFLLRTCTDSYFDARSRPCLQYQIKRCTAPCVGYVSKAAYREQLKAASAFLSGKSDSVQREYGCAMQQSAEELDFETAALWRNRIRALTAIQANQDINMQGLADADIIAVAQAGTQFCIQIFFVRAGTNYGNTAYFPKQAADAEKADILTAFIGQFYDERHPPKLLLVSDLPDEAALLSEALSISAGQKIEMSTPSRGARRQLMDMARKNAEEALTRKLAETSSQHRLLLALAEAFQMDTPPSRIEIYDNSHIQGAHAVGGMVVAGVDGFIKSAYRKFNMKSDGPFKVEAGDDFAMMRQMIFRRFERALKEDPDQNSLNWPDLLLIDGGRGQLNAVREVMQELGLDDIQIVGISKGPDRNAGREQFHIEGRESFTLPPQDPAMHYLQRLRDESHRYAIGAHRARRTKQTLSNPLDGVPGIGASRKRALLNHFGSARAVSRAGVRDLQAVDGISDAIAERLYDWFHQSSH
ncbi:excinuclease ABC subunit UvrC [Alphaproteobacteria bacterium]|nr:excinuclease ABC subunit UvrC [Alphaproteobacteria bacterium]